MPLYEINEPRITSASEHGAKNKNILAHKPMIKSKLEENQNIRK
jgi:hypothetical protein